MALNLGATALNNLYLGSTEIKKAYLGANVLFSASAAFNPASLFGGSDDGWYWEPSLATTFTDSARTTSAAVGDSIGGVTDLSGKANHGSQGTASRRMVLRQAANGSYYQESDAVDDFLETDMNLSSKRMTVAMAFKPLARDFIVLSNLGAFAPWVGIGQSGSGNLDLDGGGVTLNSTYYDNVLFTGTTRGDLYTGAQSAKSIIVDFTVDTTSWLAPIIGKFNIASFYTPGDTFAVLAIDRELTDTERASLSTYFMGLVP